MTGFSAITTDDLGFAIGESGDISLSGITEPNEFNYIAFSFDDTSAVGEYSTFRIEFSMATSLGPGCYVKVKFPSDFTTDFQLINVYGTSFLQPASGSSITLLESDYDNNLFVFQGCQRSWGSNPTGSVVFDKVRNPEYIRETGSFEIYVASDFDFEELIAYQTTGLTITEDQLSGGLIYDIDISPADTMVSAETAYTFAFTPASNIDSSTQAKLTIELPGTLAFTGSTCTIDARSSQFSFSMFCRLDGNLIELNYIFSNKPDYVGGDPLSVTISEITNAAYAADVGAFTISTYIRVDNKFYLQDSATATQQVAMTPGTIFKVADIVPGSYRASEDNVVYIFSIMAEHQVPPNGRIRVTLESDMTMQARELQNNCYRLDYSTYPITLDCFVNEDEAYFDIVVRATTFGATGLPAGEEFVF